MHRDWPTKNLLAKLEDIDNKITGEGPRINEFLAQSARDVLAGGTTLYEESIAGGSMVGGAAGLEKSSRTLAWLDRLISLRLDASTAERRAGYRGSTIIGPGDDDIRTNLTEDITTEAGVPLNYTPDDTDNADDVLDDFEVKFAQEIAQAVIAGGMEAFDNEDYETTESDLKEALELVRKLPLEQRNTYDLSDIHFKLAVCAFHIHDSSTAERALTSVVGQPSRTNLKALNLCEAGHLLSQVYLKTGKLELARSSCENSYRGRRRLLGKGHATCYESLALLSRMHELQDYKSRAKALNSMIPPDLQESVCAPLRDVNLPRLAPPPNNAYFVIECTEFNNADFKKVDACEDPQHPLTCSRKPCFLSERQFARLRVE